MSLAAPPKNTLGATGLPPLPNVNLRGVRLAKRAVGISVVAILLAAVLAVAVGAVFTVESSVQALGYTEPGELVPVRPLESGTIVDLYVASGDTVAGGSVLLHLDPFETEAELRRLRSDRALKMQEVNRTARGSETASAERRQRRERASAQVMNARSTLLEQATRYDINMSLDSLLASHVPGRHVAIDRAVADVLAAEADATDIEDVFSSESVAEQGILRAEVARIDESIQTTRSRLNRLVVKAPIAGIVVTDQVQTLHGSAVQAGQPLFQIAVPEGWRASLYVPEQDVYRVRVGDDVRLELLAFQAEGREIVSGRVLAIAEEPTQQTETGSQMEGYRVVVGVDDESLLPNTLRLRVGMSVKAWIITERLSLVESIWRRIRGKSSPN